MKDRYYSKKTKVHYSNVAAKLLKQGYKEVSYGDMPNGDGYAYYKRENITLKLIYKWIPNPQGRGYISGKMVAMEDVSMCY